MRRRRELDRLARLYGSHLKDLARRLCRNQLDPDDLVQDLFVKLMQRDQPIPDHVVVLAWLSRILIHLFIDKQRRRNARREDSFDNGAPVVLEPQPEEVWWQRLDVAQIRAMLDRIPDDQRRTFELFSFEDRSYDQIAAELRMARPTVGSRIARARQALRELLSAEHADD